MGLATRSIKPPMPTGVPIRTGRLKICSANSGQPSKMALPPVRTIPEASRLEKPVLTTSLWTKVRISSTLGSMISARVCLERTRGFLPPTLGTSMVSSFRTKEVRAHPYFILIFSASSTGVRSPIERSFVMWLPAKEKTAVCLIAPFEKITRSVVPPPMSMMATPRSFSSEVRTASLEPNCSNTMSSTSSPALLAHLMIFWAEVIAPVTI